jgi:hypothetical protein
MFSFKAALISTLAAEALACHPKRALWVLSAECCDNGSLLRIGFPLFDLLKWRANEASSTVIAACLPLRILVVDDSTSYPWSRSVWHCEQLIKEAECGHQ